MSEHVVITVDAVGGDLGSGPMLEGTLLALEADPDLEVILCGPAEVVEPFAANHDRVRAQVTTQAIEMGEHPAHAVRRKKDSSIVVGCRLVKEGQAQGFFSPGSTGACLAAATLVMGRIKGVSRPAMATILPSPVKPVVMCDVGANADCKPAYLVQFAQMASIYAEKVIGIESPTCALLNIGEEEAKGSQFAQETHALMKEQLPNFIGNCEGRDLLDCKADVVVTDGFTGNVSLKTIEGVASVLFDSLKKIMKSSPAAMLGALAMKKGLAELKDLTSADTYGGAPMLGVKGACLVGHGSSNATAVKNGILMTAKCVRLDVSGLIAQAVKKPAADE
ncbi:MAG: phosphate acyltransferase PlsX [Coriobacteriia bacterium]|nr:phosphate acyltransferase PlsX [Coriobacteriia bacterium]